MKSNPTNYAEWVEIFDYIESWEIGHTDSKVNQALNNGTIKWVSGVAERYTNRLLDLINNRFNKLNKFYNDRCANNFSLFEFQKTLITFRKELIFLKQLANLKTLPDNIKEKLSVDIMEFAKNAQKNLEAGASKDLSGEIKRMVLGNRIDNI